jgi:redox-sensitive bicupin YhaK (pirin superfamily)
VRRLLPGHPHKMVGPFIFFDHMGPARLQPGTGVDVRPHPHIGLATVTYLFEGCLMHRDSLGNAVRIEPGAVNWMTAGRGIAHSERSPDEERPAGPRLHGIQSWVALPQAHERGDPDFSHHPKETIPLITLPGVYMHLIAGTAFGRTAPTPTFSPMFYLAVEMEPGSRLELPFEHEERGVFAVSGEIDIDGSALPARHLAVVPSSGSVRIAAHSAARGDAARRRTARRRSSYLVELCRELARDDRRGRSTLGKRRFRACARRNGTDTVAARSRRAGEFHTLKRLGLAHP